MPLSFMRFVLAAAIAGCGLPAWAAGMPDWGTKNFSPGGDTPAYFTNETGAVVGAVAEGSDDGADTPLRAAQSTSQPPELAAPPLSRHGRHMAGRKVASHSVARGAAKSRSAHAERAGNVGAVRMVHAGRAAPTPRATKTALTTHNAAPAHARAAAASVRHASAKSSSRKG